MFLSVLYLQIDLAGDLTLIRARLERVPLLSAPAADVRHRNGNAAEKVVNVRVGARACTLLELLEEASKAVHARHFVQVLHSVHH